MGHTLLGGGSPLNKFKEIDKHLSRNSRTVHVDLLGDDERGDGSLGKPFATIKRALQDAVGTTRRLTIDLSAGVHSLSGKTAFSNVFVAIVGDGVIEFNSLGNSPFYCNSSELSILCGITDISTENYSTFCNLDLNSSLLIEGGSLVLSRCTSALISNGYGCNSALLLQSNISSANAIQTSKENGNTQSLSVFNVSMTLTNVN